MNVAYGRNRCVHCLTAASAFNGSSIVGGPIGVRQPRDWKQGYGWSYTLRRLGDVGGDDLTLCGDLDWIGIWRWEDNAVDRSRRGWCGACFGSCIDYGTGLGDGVIDGDRRWNGRFRGYILDFVRKALLNLRERILQLE
jgi:hypothetical protein